MRRLTIAALTLLLLASAGVANASTYAAYIPLDSSIYGELDTLNDLGVVQSYLATVKPISRVEAARLTIEAERNSNELDYSPLADSIITALRLQLAEEISWLESDGEDTLPTMMHPVERIEGGYVFSSGKRRAITTSNGTQGINWREATPLLAGNDNISTAAGSNEVLRWSGWGGFGGFLTGYGEAAVSGPLSRDSHGIDRAQLLTGAMVVSLGNTAISFGKEEMAWGVGRYGSLSQGSNGSPFPALRAQNIHPSHLPGIFRYLGLMRWQSFFGQLDGDRIFSRPWIVGQNMSFKTLPSLEWGITHGVMFGGAGNDNYSWMGFLGRATGLATGNPKGANTNQRVGMFANYRMNWLRGTQLYGEILGEDFFQPFGRGFIKTPFKAPSYQVGLYVPRVTEDGQTTARFEYLLLDQEYSQHSDSLYWTYENRLMGHSLGPRAWQVHFTIGRWLDLQSKLDLDFFFSKRQPVKRLTTAPFGNEQSYGVALDFIHLPIEISYLAGSLGEMRGRVAVEYVNGINYTNQNSMRAMVELVVGLTPSWPSLRWK
ncbi:MAG: capsule assembly Wzi family protein [Candidatus Binataceae bacterium]